MRPGTLLAVILAISHSYVKCDSPPGSAEDEAEAIKSRRIETTKDCYNYDKAIYDNDTCLKHIEDGLLTNQKACASWRDTNDDKLLQGCVNENFC